MSRHIPNSLKCRFRSLSLGLSLLAAISIGMIGHARAGGGSSYASDIQNNWIKGMEEMTSQIIGAGVDLTGIIGSFFDAAQTLKTQTTLQRLQAEAIKDYTPGENLCRIGTLGRSLAASGTNADAQQSALSTLMLSRETNKSARIKPTFDHDARSKLEKLKSLYCDPGDNDKVPPACNCDVKAGTCTSGSEPIPPRHNRDIDFAKLFGSRLTLDVNFTDDTMTADEQDVMGFFDNVSSYETFSRWNQYYQSLKRSPTSAYLIQDMRQIFATRGVVRNSLSRITAEKAAGAAGSSAYMEALMQELGMTANESKRFLESEGEKTTYPGSAPSGTNISPSYDAQMEILTKKLVQNPNFYISLVEQPANIERTKAALAAIHLMQRRGIFETALRRELLLSQLLEIQIRNYEKVVNKNILGLKSTSQ